jgi:DNA polymerase III delta subunit
MKLIILHGDNTLKSYERLLKFVEVARERGWEVARVVDKTQNIPEILASESLFGSQKLVVIEKINFINKKTSSWLKTNFKTTNANLVIYHQGIISKTFLKLLPKPDKIEEYKLPKLIWSFLDSFSPGNARNCLLLLHVLVKDEPIEFVFSLLAKHVRDLYWVKTDPKSVPYPSWRVGKLSRQAGKFSKTKLIDTIVCLANADIKVKTTQENLINLLDFIIATQLE